MDRVEEYRRHAEKADALAERLSDPQVRRLFRQIAEQWRQLACQQERLRVADDTPLSGLGRPLAD